MTIIFIPKFKEDKGVIAKQLILYNRKDIRVLAKDEYKPLEGDIVEYDVMPDKQNGLLLDFAENVQRFGFIDEIVFSDKKPSDKEDVPPVKTCPECDSIVPASVAECPFCGYVFPRPEPEFNKEAYAGAVLSTQVMPEWKNVVDMYVSKHKSAKPTPTLKIEYVCDNFERYYEFICLEHDAGTLPRNKAIRWWKENTDLYKITDIPIAKWLIQEHGFDNIPKTIDDAVKLKEAIIQPGKINIIQDGKFWKVLARDNTPLPPKNQPEPINIDGLEFEDCF